MRYLQNFNESQTVDKFEDFNKWVPECFKYLSYLKSLNPKRGPTFCPNMFYQLRLLGGDIDNPSEFIKSCKVFNQEHKHKVLKNFYNGWLQINKIDIYAYKNIEEILEYICDENNCKFDLYRTDFHILEISQAYFDIVIYDIYSEMKYNPNPICIGNKTFILDKNRLKGVTNSLNEFKDNFSSCSSRVCYVWNEGAYLNIRIILKE